MQITTRVADAVAVVRLAGDLDARTAPAAQAGLAQVLADRMPVVLDLTEVDYVSSAGLRTMLIVYRQAQHQGIAIILVGVSDTLKSILSATGFLRFFDVSETVTDAISAVRPPR